MKKSLKRLLSAVLSIMLMASLWAVNVSAEAVTQEIVDAAIGNTLINGSFENNVTGWSTENAAVSRDIENTYNNSAGAAHVVVADGEIGYIHQSVKIRKYTWYTYSVAVKNADADATNVSAKLYLDYTADTWNIASTKEFSSVRIGNDWTIISGYFMKTNETSAQDTWNNDDFFQTARVRLQISGSRDYYIDDFKLTMHEGTYNPNFENGTDGWNYPNSTDGNKTLEVTTATEDDGVENVGKNVMNVTLSSNNSGLNQVICLEKGVEYEVNAKFKPVEEITDRSSVRIRVNRTLPTNASSNITSHYFGATPVTSNSKWFTLRSSYVYDGEAPYAYADFKLWTYINGVGNAVGFEYKVLSFEVKKRTNVMENPCLIKAEAGVNASEAPALSEWKGSPKIEQTLINQSKLTDSPSTVYDTYDNSNSRLYFAPSSTGTGPYQEVELEKNRKYKISIALKAAKEGATYYLRARHYVTTESGVKANDYMLPTGSTYQSVPTTWTKVEVDSYEFTLPENYDHSEMRIYAKCTDTTNLIYIDDFSVEPIASAPSVNAREITATDNKLKIGDNLTANVSINKSADTVSYSYRYMLYDSNEAVAGTPVYTGHTDTTAGISSTEIPTAWVGKYIQLEVTPLSDKGVWGDTKKSNLVYIKDLFDVSSGSNNGYTGSFENGGTITADVTVLNDSGDSAKIIVVIAYFEDGVLKDTELEEVNLLNGEEKLFDPAITLPGTLGTNPGVKVFIWKGDGKLNPITPAYPRA